ncbi:unnamed protein product [Notodromas monacha]|uniref:GMP synthase (glutamine-hydrolyzing) n=1 Tax=Notodromas monacha TaxID=399045 RepID=A0A7R9BLA8_9CRUS|nr:unnamed protein product [Notodromas monacha]CAG0916256.1 unnamed protein product [Notodromas monacha]
MAKLVDKVAILDAGSPYAKKLDRACRASNVESQVIALETPAHTIKSKGYKALLVSGGAGSINTFDSPWYDPGIFSLGVPVLGLNYGMSMLIKTYNGSVRTAGGRQTGVIDAVLDDSLELFKGCKSKELALVTHGDTVEKLVGLKAIAHWRKRVIGVADVSKNLYGLHFHPEVIVTPKGQKMLDNFFKMAKLKTTFNIAKREEKAMDRIRKQCSGRPVLMLCSGGLDSTVAAMILKKCIGAQEMYCLLVETGFEKKGGFEKAKDVLEKIGVGYSIQNAFTRFYSAQTTIPNRANPAERRRETKWMVDQTEPEDKRVICRDVLFHIAEEFLIEKFGGSNDACIGLGSLRSDILDMGGHLAAHAARVSKSHSNNVDVQRKYRHEDRIIEPVGEFHKKEVVQVGKDIGLSNEQMTEHPFPSEIGIALRLVSMHLVHVGRHFAETQVLCKCVTEFDKVKSDHALMSLILGATDEEDRKEMKTVAARSKFVATVMPLEVVGMHGPKKTYYYACALSDNKDLSPKWEDVFFMARMICRVCHDVNRVAYAFGGKVPHIIRDITPTYMTRHNYDMVRAADYLAHDVLRQKGVYNKVDQMPVVLIPIHFDRGLLSGEPSVRRSIVLRPFISPTLMSGHAAMPGKDIPNDAMKEIVTTLKKLPGISRILIDVTHKPPAHVEWQ